MKRLGLRLLNTAAAVLLISIGLYGHAYAENATDTRTVVCKDNHGNVVADSYCTGTKPETTRVGQTCEAMVPTVNGACGPAHGVTAIGAPTSGLCASGTAAQFSADHRSWVCQGTGGGTNSGTCAAKSLMAGCRVETMGWDTMDVGGNMASQSGLAYCRTQGVDPNNGGQTKVNYDRSNEIVVFMFGSEFKDYNTWAAERYGGHEAVGLASSEISRFTVTWTGAGTVACGAGGANYCRMTPGNQSNGTHTARAVVTDTVSGNSTTFDFSANKDTLFCTGPNDPACVEQ